MAIITIIDKHKQSVYDVHWKSDKNKRAEKTERRCFIFIFSTRNNRPALFRALGPPVNNYYFRFIAEKICRQTINCVCACNVNKYICAGTYSYRIPRSVCLIVGTDKAPNICILKLPPVNTLYDGNGAEMGTLLSALDIYIF